MATTQRSTHPKCFDRELLADFTLGKLPVAELERIAAELETCPLCLSALDTLADMEDSVVADLRSGAAEGVGRIHAELEGQIREAEQISQFVWGQPKPDVPEEPLPKHLGQYEVLEKIGQGGMGTVYKALHIRLKRLVAMKMLSAARLADPPAVARFQREVEAVGRLSHPNIVQALDANEINGQHFLVTEFVDGVNLSQLIRSVGPLPIADACEVIRQAAMGLQHAHDHGLVHRDVKPSNLMLTTGGIVKVLDLGLARLRPETPVEGDMTARGQILGSPDYMAPEQGLDSRGVDARADVYSLGCTLYFLLVRRPPFADRQHRTFTQKVLAHSQEPVAPIRELRPDVPAEVAELLGRMLAKNAAARCSTAADVAAALGRFTAGSDLVALLGNCRTAPAEESHGTDEELSSGMWQHHQPSPKLVPRSVRLRWFIIGILVLTALTPLGLWYGLTAVGILRGHAGVLAAGESSGRAVAVRHDHSTQASDPVAVAQMPNQVAASRAAAAYLTRAELPTMTREAMLTVLRQHPDETRWSGHSDTIMFAVVVKPLPAGSLRQRTVPAILSLTHMLAMQELLKAKSLLDQYAGRGLTDATTLRQAVIEAAGKLQVKGQTQGVIHQATVQEDFAVAYVIADETALIARLLEPVEFAKVGEAYRDVMHRQARDLMKQGNWQDALLLWQHLHKRGLVSPQLYLDAARCFVKLGQNGDAVQVLAEAIDSLKAAASPEFLEEAGDIALTIETEAAQKLAERTYRAAAKALEQSSPQSYPWTDEKR
jgi:serine/threonine protein kinase